MKIKINLSLERISSFLKKYHFFILGIIFILLLCFNAFIYYQYVYVATNMNVDPVDDRIVVDEDVLKKVIESIDERKDNLIRVKTESYSTPFDD